MSDVTGDDEREQMPEDRSGLRDDDSVLNALSGTAQRFLQDPDARVAENQDLPDDESGVEVPQDGSPDR